MFDLGVSSYQLDALRGFSFRRDEPVDMRMDQTSGLLLPNYCSRPAKTNWSVSCANTAKRTGPGASRARLWNAGQRPADHDDRAVAETVEQAIPRKAWPRDIHVATRTFQGLRIAVNDELGQLKVGLLTAIERLQTGGRIAVISYHSLEDRIVKQTFAQAAGAGPSAPGSSPAAFLPPTHEPTLRLLTRKPIVPTDAEIARNPRARSAKLRIAERLP